MILINLFRRQPPLPFAPDVVRYDEKQLRMVARFRQALKEFEPRIRAAFAACGPHFKLKVNVDWNGRPYVDIDDFAAHWKVGKDLHGDALKRWREMIPDISSALGCKPKSLDLQDRDSPVFDASWELNGYAFDFWAGGLNGAAVPCSLKVRVMMHLSDDCEVKEITETVTRHVVSDMCKSLATKF